jgi:hypothetical protein
MGASVCAVNSLIAVFSRWTISMVVGTSTAQHLGWEADKSSIVG